MSAVVHVNRFVAQLYRTPLAGKLYSGGGFNRHLNPSILEVSIDYRAGHVMLKRTFALLGSVFFILIFLTGTAEAKKTDIVKLVNGDAVTGEVKSLDFGSLRYGTDSMGTVSIDWEDVTGLTSDQSLQVELVDGTRYFGSLISDEKESYIAVKTNNGEFSFPTNGIVRITPIEAEVGFLEKLDGSFSLGFQAQKSSEVNTSNVAADISYRARKYLVGLRLNSSVTDQPTEETKARQSLELNYQRFRPNRWFADWFVGWERNDELGIQIRTSAGGAYGRYLVQTNKNMLSLTAGVQASRETYTGQDPSDTVPEGRIEVRYLHRNITPDTSFNFTTQIYPKLRDLSDYRAETDLSFKREFIEDVYFELSLGYSYISDPPTDAEKADYVVTTSIGYSF